MITAIQKSMAAKRDSIKNNEDRGFTLIELLVVVLIIGILAAIAIPVFLGQQNSAKDAATKSDLTTAKIALLGYAADHNGVYSTDDSDLAPYGYVASTGVTMTWPAAITDGSFCLEAVHGDTDKVFSVTHADPVAEASCAAAPVVP